MSENEKEGNRQKKKKDLQGPSSSSIPTGHGGHGGRTKRCKSSQTAGLWAYRKPETVSEHSLEDNFSLFTPCESKANTKALRSGGEREGLEEDAARRIVFHTVFQAVFVFFDSDLRPGFLFYFVRAIKKINL